MNLIEQSQEFVKQECLKPSSKYGFEPFENHFQPVFNYAIALAKKLGADEEIVGVSAWMHDIGSIIIGRENHEITGAEITEQKLKEWDCSPDKIQAIKKCILNHRGSKKSERKTNEEKIVAEADAMSHFDTIPGMFKAAFVYENLNQHQAKISIRNKLANSYEKLSKEAKEIIKPKFEAAMLLLGDK